MKKKMFALLTAALCMSAPLTAMAGDIDADSNAALTISTDKFTYTNNTTTSYKQGFFLESKLADPDLMVIGECRYDFGELYGELYGVLVTPINYVNSGLGEIPLEVVKEQFGDRQLEIGDLIKVNGGVISGGGAYVTNEEDPESTMTWLGNGVDVFGEEFARVIRMQLVLDEQAYNAFEERRWSPHYIDLVKGDVSVDDKVNILDSIQINKSLLAGAPLCDYAKLAGDVNENGEIDMDDSLMILKETIGLTENFE